MSTNGDKTLRCHAPDCKSPVLRGGERHDGSDPDPGKGRGHAVDVEGRTYHYGCYFRILRRVGANPTGSAA